ncbi:hypothetical protein HID58_005940 [Brassica napus]|uniref:Galactose oxidase/kelch repeat superfamily protein n=1 Tax=Brassica napus TaxID=3708 RepID=A0ABQ8E9Z4_BRANA|nr:hypothetical protein HID58_005940 [Brassica napus]
MRWERVQRQAGLADSSSGPGKRWGHTCNAVKGGRFVYVFGGFGRDGYFTSQVHVFDAGRQIWSEPMMRGVPPSPRDSHSCTTVGDNLFVYGGTDGKYYLNDLHVLDTCKLLSIISSCVVIKKMLIFVCVLLLLASHTWKCLEVRGEEPDAREAHSATLVGKHIFVFGGRGKVPGLDDEVYFNDLYILNTETITWQRAVTTGTRPFARDGHTCSTWNNKIIVVGGEHFEGEYLSDVHILDTDTFAWKQMKTSWQQLTPRAGHITVAIERNLFVFGGFRDPQSLYNDLYVLDVDGVVEARSAQTRGRLPLRKLKCKEQQKEAVEQGKTVFQARVTENSPLGYYTIETIIDGKVLRGVLLSNRHHSSVQTADPSSTSRQVYWLKRSGMLDADCDHRAKTQRTLSKDTAGSSQQAGPVDPSDDAYKKANVEPLRNEMSTDVGAGGDSSPQKQDEERVAAEDAEPK